MRQPPPAVITVPAYSQWTCPTASLAVAVGWNQSPSSSCTSSCGSGVPVAAMSWSKYHSTDVGALTRTSVTNVSSSSSSTAKAKGTADPAVRPDRNRLEEYLLAGGQGIDEDDVCG